MMRGAIADDADNNELWVPHPGRATEAYVACIAGACKYCWGMISFLNIAYVYLVALNIWWSAYVHTPLPIMQLTDMQSLPAILVLFVYLPDYSHHVGCTSPNKHVVCIQTKLVLVHVMLNNGWWILSNPSWWYVLHVWSVTIIMCVEGWHEDELSKIDLLYRHRLCRARSYLVIYMNVTYTCIDGYIYWCDYCLAGLPLNIGM